MGPEVWRKGQALLKQFVIGAGRESDYYTPTLKLLSMVEAKLAAERRAQADDAAYAAAAAQDTPEGYEEYVQRYPTGRHVGAARVAQQRLRAEAARQRILGPGERTDGTDCGRDVYDGLSGWVLQ